MKSTARLTFLPYCPRPGVLPADKNAIPANAHTATLRLYPPEPKEPSSCWCSARNANPFAADSLAAAVKSAAADFSGSATVLPFFSSAAGSWARANPNAPISAGGANHIAPHVAVRSRNRRRLTGIINASNYFRVATVSITDSDCPLPRGAGNTFQSATHTSARTRRPDVCIICSRMRSGKFPQASFIRSRIVAGSGLASSSRRV